MCPLVEPEGVDTRERDSERERAEDERGEDPEDDGGDMDQDEGARVRSHVVDRKPGPKEVAEHRVTHHPYRSWCEDCVAGQSRRDPQRAASSEPEIPVLAMDYAYLSGEWDDRDVELRPILVIMDSMSKAVWASMVEAKGLDAFALDFATRVVEETGYKRIIIRCDPEGALAALRNAVAEALPGVELVPETAARGDHNNLAELAVNRVKEIARTLWTSTSRDYQTEIGPNHPIMPWLVRHAAMVLARFAVQEDGRTPYQRLTGRKFTRVITNFGANVMFRRDNKRNARCEEWGHGIFLGLASGSTENLYGTLAGVVRGKFFRPRGSAEQTWDASILNGFGATPWEPVPGREGWRIPVGTTGLEDGLRIPPPLEMMKWCQTR